MPLGLALTARSLSSRKAHNERRTTLSAFSGRREKEERCLTPASFWFGAECTLAPRLVTRNAREEQLRLALSRQDCCKEQERWLTPVSFQ